MSEQTLESAPVTAAAGVRRAVLHDFEGLAGRRLAGTPVDEAAHRFRVQLAQSVAQHRTASLLVQRMYAWRGYQGMGPGWIPESPQRTLVICEGNAVLGTMTISGDRAGHRLSVEQSFAHEVQALRYAGQRLCEVTKLAVDGDERSKELLAVLFHAGYRYIEHAHAAQTILVEVNPRHVRFYVKLLGFEIISGVRMNERVNAPAVLLSLNLAYGLSEIERLGGKPHLAAVEKSFYPFFLAPEDEARVFVGNWARRHGG